jgi:RNA polymerase sigma-70 factor (ECF subfamily)
MPDAKKLFETLVREHADMLSVYLKAALGDVADVDDLFQETMVVAWRRLDDFDQSRPFGAWLRGIAKKLLLAHVRKSRRNRYTPIMLDRLDTRLGQLGRQDGDTWHEKLGILKACVRALPHPYRNAVTLRYIQRQTVQQVSDALSISVAAAKKRLERARTMLRDCMKNKLAPNEL